MRKLTFAVFAVISVLSVSCIKEDRNDCPCWIEFDFSKFEPVEYQEIYTAVWEPKNPQHTVFKITGGGSYIVQVGHGTHEVTCFTGLHMGKASNGVVTIPKGFQADSLIAYTQRVECVEETSPCVPLPHRQFATVNLTIKDENLEENVKDIRIVSDVNGLNCRTMTPVKGDLEFLLPASETHEYRFRVPRQTLDSVLELDLVRESGTADTLPLGTWIIASGYDWYAADLEEMNVLIDRADAATTVTISGWSGGEDYVVEF